MADVSSIPFKQADPNGHYRSKQLPNDSGDFMSMLGLPPIAGDVKGPGGATAGQAVIFSDATGKRIDAATQTGLAKLASGLLSAVPAPIGAVVGTTDVQTLTNKTLTNPTITGLTGLTKTDVGLGNVDNTSDANKPVSGPQQAALNLKQDLAAKASANGYASLDASAKVPLSQIPDSVVGGQQYQGTWNAATNVPALPSPAIGNKGWYYSVNVAGTTVPPGGGPSSWAVGDQVISNGSVWQKIANVSAVNSVNGYTGVVVIGKNDVGLGNVDNTSDASKPVSAATVTQLNLKEDKANKGVANGYASLDATGKVPVAQAPPDAVTTVAGRQGDVVLTKTDVGLSNVDNTSDATKNAAAVTLTNKTINGANNTLTVRLASDVTGNLPVTNLNAGTGANSGSFWRGDGQWAPPAGGGDVVGPASAVDSEFAIYNGTTGKVLKRQATITAANISAATINGQTEKTAAVDPEDQFLEVDSTTGLLRYIRAKWFSKFPRNHLSGLLTATNLTNLTNGIDVAAGECRDDSNSADMVLGTAITNKKVDVVWVAGSGQGGRDSTVALADGSWMIWLIKNPSTGVVDVLLSNSTPTLPSGYTLKRRIGSFYRATGTNRRFEQMGDFFMYFPAVTVINSTFGTNQILGTTTGAPVIGKRIKAALYVQGTCATGWFNGAIYTDSSFTQGACFFCNAANFTGGQRLDQWTHTDGTVQFGTTGAAGNVAMILNCLGWYDTRDKDA